MKIFLIPVFGGQNVKITDFDRNLNCVCFTPLKFCIIHV